MKIMMGSLLILKNPNSEEQETIDLKNVLAVSTHESDLVSFLLRWLTEPVIVIIIFVIAVLLPEVKYRRID